MVDESIPPSPVRVIKVTLPGEKRKDSQRNAADIAMDELRRMDRLTDPFQSGPHSTIKAWEEQQRQRYLDTIGEHTKQAAEFAKSFSAYGGFDAVAAHKQEMERIANSFHVGAYESAKVWEEQRLESLAGLDKYLSAADKQLSMLANNPAADFVAKHFGVSGGLDAALEQSRQMERIAEAAAFDPWKETLAKALFRDEHSLEVMNRALEPLNSRAFAAVGGEAASILAAGAFSVMSDLKSQIDKLTVATPQNIIADYGERLLAMGDFAETARGFYEETGKLPLTPLPRRRQRRGVHEIDKAGMAVLQNQLREMHSKLVASETKNGESQERIDKLESEKDELAKENKALIDAMKRFASEGISFFHEFCDNIPKSNPKDNELPYQVDSDDAALGRKERARRVKCGELRQAEAAVKNEWWEPYIKERNELVANGQSKSNASKIVANKHPNAGINPDTLRQK